MNAKAASSTTGAEPIPDTLRRLVALSIDGMQARLELMRLELGEERRRLGGLITKGLFAAFLIFLSLQLLAVFAIALSWDSGWRIPVIASLTALALLSTFLAIRAYRITPESTLFDDSIHAIGKDARAVDGPR